MARLTFILLATAFFVSFVHTSVIEFQFEDGELEQKNRDKRFCILKLLR